jgi:hypothetical protein
MQRIRFKKRNTIRIENRMVSVSLKQKLQAFFAGAFLP